MCGKPHHKKSFYNLSMWARTTIDESILNSVVMAEEERKRTVLASTKKSADMLLSQSEIHSLALNNFFN